MGGVLLIAGLDHPLAADFASYVSRKGRCRVVVLASPGVLPEVVGSAELYDWEHANNLRAVLAHGSETQVDAVLFLNRNANQSQEALIEALARLARQVRLRCLCLVSTLLVHFSDSKAESLESLVVQQFQGACDQIRVIRPGHVVGTKKRLAAWLALLSDRWKSCFLAKEALFAMLEQVLADPGAGRTRAYTLLGPNRPWNSFSSRERSRAFLFVRALLSWLFVDRALGVLLSFLTRYWPALRAWNFDTLYPGSTRELLDLYNPYNYRYVKIVGYNNGVTHFGNRYPGKTVVSTVRGARPARLRGALVKLDAGATLHAATERLRAAGKAFHVLPNYSYVSVGTAFFVPIHGSASQFSTIAETIEKVVLYDPSGDRVTVARRSHSDFGRYLYNLNADVLLLRLYVRVTDQRNFYVRRQELASPSSQQVLGLFHDPEACNVEVRKAGAASPAITVNKYYATAPNGNGDGLEVPRDGLGSLWDRLEENALTSVLFHGLMRRLAHHVELFLSDEEFSAFWATHQKLPLKKIQLRFIKEDGMPNSPFQKGDAISVDLFMLRKHRQAFEQYLKQTFGSVRLNPGKHSMN